MLNNEQLKAMEEAALKDFSQAKNRQELYNFKTHYLGKKGSLTQLSKQIPQLPVKDRPFYGQKLNVLREKIERTYQNLQSALRSKELEQKMEQERLDLTLPAPRRLRSIGGGHPIGKVMEDIFSIMSRLGYSLRLGPAVEKDFNNFDALNIPKDHPAREMQDTFFLKGDRVLRTHTSPIQVRSLREESPPLRILGMGAVFRRDSDVSHLPHFHQVEGMCVDKKVSMADLKGTLQFLLQEFFGKKVAIRFRPSFFPFTEPSAEVDCSCPLCHGREDREGKKGREGREDREGRERGNDGGHGAMGEGDKGKSQKGCAMCSQSGWVEVAGCGLMHPRVLEIAQISPQKWQGFAFGLGVERMAIIKYGIPDIRLFPENNIHFLNQFVL